MKNKKKIKKLKKKVKSLKDENRRLSNQIWMLEKRVLHDVKERKSLLERIEGFFDRVKEIWDNL